MTKAATILRFEEKGPEDTGLTEWETIDPAGLESGTPVQRGHIYHEDAAHGYLSGVWDCTAQTERMAPYPVDEFMFLLEGSLVMGLPDGTDVEVEQGQAFIIPKGFECQWKQAGYLRKLFMILDATVPEAGDNPALHRITVPDLSGSPGGGVVTDRVDFINAAGSMQAGLRLCADMKIPAMPVRANLLLHVLSGCLTLTSPAGDETFTSGQTAYVLQGGTVDWQTEGETRILWSSYAQV
ncbi:hypothetical protein DQW77_14015 [Roseovarius sp. TE539]|uniref:cupin domain-containing protein n=1 Tax=Roseovarius sp. TE539 TaxID=2249812 RepID=UPI000DDF33E4|nr:cupin domain-containing protein [Roseovarius sp. TE539]RBI70329.1 hypothetical protein DQW77_14015 [Roseovarius sp. TE539]